MNVRQDNTINYAGLYYPSLNEMVLYTLDDDVFCHESIHSFRDDYVMGLSTYEEGMTRATEIEVFNQHRNYPYWDSSHSYTYDYFYEALNAPEIATYNGSFITNAAFILLRYQLGSYLWTKAYLEDNNFLKRFNDSLYSGMQSDPNTAYSEIKLRNIFANIKPVVEGLPNSIWYSRQFLLNTSPTDGFKLYQEVNQFVIYYFNRDRYSDTLQGGVTVNWTLFNHNNDILGSGNDITTSYGWISFYPNFPDGYYGKIKIVASVQSPDGLITDTAYRIQQYSDQGIFGVVEDANSGSISVTPLDTAIATVTTNLINGAFTFPTLENVRGRFMYVFTYPDNKVVSRIFTKDRSMYYLLIKNDSKTYWVGSADSSWHNPLNWSGGLVPGEFSDVIINSANPFNCTINIPATCRSLELSNGTILTTNSNLSILH